MDLQAAVNAEVIPWLHSDSAANLVWLTEAELYQWLDRMARILARDGLLFVEKDTSITITPGTASYAVPARHIATLYAAAGSTDGDGPYGLSPANVEELEALSHTWPDDQDVRPRQFVHDQGLERITFYPLVMSGRPNYPATLVVARYLAEITTGNYTVTAPACLRPLFSLHALAEANSYDTEGRMAETGLAIRPLLETLTATVRRYFSG